MQLITNATNLNAIRPRSDSSTPMYRDGRKITDSLLHHVGSKGPRYHRNVLTLTRAVLSERHSSMTHHDSVYEIIKSGVLLSLLNLELNEEIDPGCAGSLLRHSSADIASRICRSVMVDRNGCIRLNILSTLNQLDFRVEVTGSNKGDGFRSLQILTAKGPLFVCDFSLISGFAT